MRSALVPDRASAGWAAGSSPQDRRGDGEAAEAITGALGANQLKGNSHRWQDVERGFSDVIVTAALAVATSGPDPEKALADRVQALLDRLDLS